MPRFPKMALCLMVACLTASLALRAQEPAPNAPANQPTAKDVVKAIEKQDPEKAVSEAVKRIREEGLERSKVMETLSYLTDVIGPRLTGSPNLKRANEWTKSKLAEWGLENAHLEAWGPFGRGWSLKRFSAQVVEPQCIPLIAYPKAWSPGTDGTLVGAVVYLDAQNEDELAKYKGKLKGAIVLTGPPRTLSARFEPLGVRLTEKELLTLADAPEPSPRAFGRPQVLAARAGAPPSNDQARAEGQARAAGPGPQDQRPGRGTMPFNRRKLEFLIEEGAALLVDPSPQGDGGTLFVAAASVPGGGMGPAAPAGPGGRRITPWGKDAPKTVPQIVVASEHYNRLVRMIQQGEALKLAVELAVQFHEDDEMAYNTIAEIPGTDLKNEVVMLGGHMDSWHSGTGATDNGAGVAAAMEAVRILKALDLKPRRTIRIGLWSGEEQGLLGSRAYVTEHFGKSPSLPFGPPPSNNGDEAKSAETSPKPEFETFSAYFNLDNGTGKLRGVYLQGNEAVRPIFRKWLQPFRDLGAATLSIANTGGTDHQAFDGIGLPGFQFIQDPIEYRTRTHHSNQDVFDRLQADDLKQASVILAAFVYNTAMYAERLPRKPAPKPAQPVAATTPEGPAATAARTP
jgi:carboxypeptidase Q